jgi:ATP-dependent DNA ligase
MPVRESPESEERSRGTRLDEAKMTDCGWLTPQSVGQFEFLECTGDNHLRHTKFIGLREAKPARAVRRE